MTDERKFFDQPINNIKTWKQKNCYRPRRWLHNWLSTRLSLFQRKYKLVAIDLTKEQALDADVTD